MSQVHHMVLLSFKPEVSDTAIAEILQKVEGLKQSIPGIDYCASGAYFSPEGFNKGFTHGFLTTFTNPVARDRYLSHPDHESVRNALFVMIIDAIAFDFIAK
jgi:hypothetical protein